MESLIPPYSDVPITVESLRYILKRLFKRCAKGAIDPVIISFVVISSFKVSVISWCHEVVVSDILLNLLYDMHLFKTNREYLLKHYLVKSKYDVSKVVQGFSRS